MLVQRPVTTLTRLERLALGAFFALMVLFGGVVVVRGAFLHQRFTDLAVFLRAGWAVRTGADLYAMTEDRGLTYNYPPLLAILLVPVADPPAAYARSTIIPFAVKVALWYILSLCLLAAGVHALARALERSSLAVAQKAGAPWSRSWWHLRLIPVLACLPVIGHDLSLGQVNILWLALLCASAAAALSNRPFTSGLWLAGSACLKVLPVFLIALPLWRRDRRCLAGCAVGLLSGLLLLPSMAIGPKRTLDYARQWCDSMLWPAYGLKASDLGRQLDFLSISATHNQSLVATIHKTIHLDRRTRPLEASRLAKLAGWTLGGLMTLWTMAASGRRPSNGTSFVLTFGSLVINMLLLAPGGHSHYLLLNVIVLMALLAASWEDRLYEDIPIRTLALLTFATTALPLLGGHVFHDLGVAMYGSIVLWFFATRTLWRRRRPRAAALPEPIRAAA